MPPAYVKPYVKRGKTDAADAEAICEAVTRPTMRFVPVKSQEQQAALSMHRARDLFVKQRTQLINMMRGLMAEFGIDIPQGINRALEKARAIVSARLSGAEKASRPAAGSASSSPTIVMARCLPFIWKVTVQPKATREPSALSISCAVDCRVGGRKQ